MNWDNPNPDRFRLTVREEDWLLTDAYTGVNWIEASASAALYKARELELDDLYEEVME